MRFRTALFAAAMVFALVATAVAQMNIIPRNTVVPVVLDQSLGSTVSQLGETFVSHCPGPNCGGFPSNTQFVGVVTSVTRAHGETPGQLGVSFTQATLPDGRVIPINGALIPLDPNAVSTDANTGLLMGREVTGADRNRFIAYGAGAGLVIGAITGNTLKGGLAGAAAGWLYGATIGRGTGVRDVMVPAGTQFGVQLIQPVDIRGGTRPTTVVPPTPLPGRGPEGCPFQVVYAGNVTPFVTNRGIVMVPARATIQALGLPFKYNMNTNTLNINTRRVRATHRLNTATAIINGRQVRLSAPSRMQDTTLYVPSDLLSALTGYTVTWQAETGILRVE